MDIDKEMEEWIQHDEAMELAFQLMEKSPLSVLDIDEEFPIQDFEGINYLDYLPWIVEDFPQAQNEKLVKHVYTYLNKKLM